MVGEVVASAALAAACFFYIAGSLGVLRFPDAFCRIHAVSKADNLGLGFVVLALVIRADDAFVAAKLLLIWALVLIASASSSYLIALSAARSGEGDLSE